MGKKKSENAPVTDEHTPEDSFAAGLELEGAEAMFADDDEIHRAAVEAGLTPHGQVGEDERLAAAKALGVGEVGESQVANVLEDEGEEDAPDEEDEPEEDADEDDEEAEEAEEEAPEEDIAARAKSLGIDEETLEGLGDNAEATIALLERQRTDMDASIIQTYHAVQQQAPGQQQPAQQQQTAPTPQQVQQQQQQQQQQGQLTEEDLGIDLERYDPDIGQAFQKVLGQLNAVQSALQQQQAQAQRAQQQEILQAFDRQVAQLGDDFAGVFGKGNSLGLAPDSPQRQARERVLAAMDALDAYHQARGQHLSEDELFGRAVAAETRELQKKLAVKEVKQQVKIRQKKAIGRPGRRKAGSTTPKDPYKEAQEVYEQEAKRLGAL